MVMPGSEGSKADIPTPKIRADPSHLKQFIMNVVIPTKGKNPSHLKLKIRRFFFRKGDKLSGY